MISISNMGIIALLLLFISALPSAADDELKYGSKVLWHDVDEARPLCPFYAGPEFAFVDAGIRGIFDPEDPVYVNIDARDSQVNENDVRLTPFGSIPAGTQVRIDDPDYGYKLSRFGIMGFPAAEMRYFDVDGDMAYSLDDPVYLDIKPGVVNAGDIRINGYLGYEAGGRVRDAQADSDKPTLTLPGMLSFFNANGNINNGGWGIYDYGDLVYMDTQYPFYEVTINDVRLTS
ncbi:MAG: hypothetical protein JW986_08665 [Methanotrichaceae archaeon]|nr:hypothetical protein [Methanotrichaceae archaeon]